MRLNCRESDTSMVTNRIARAPRGEEHDSHEHARTPHPGRPGPRLPRPVAPRSPRFLEVDAPQRARRAADRAPALALLHGSPRCRLPRPPPRCERLARMIDHVQRLLLRAAAATTLFVLAGATAAFAADSPAVGM